MNMRTPSVDRSGHDDVKRAAQALQDVLLEALLLGFTVFVVGIGADIPTHTIEQLDSVLLAMHGAAYGQDTGALQLLPHLKNTMHSWLRVLATIARDLLGGLFDIKRFTQRFTAAFTALIAQTTAPQHRHRIIGVEFLDIRVSRADTVDELLIYGSDVLLAALGLPLRLHCVQGNSDVRQGLLRFTPTGRHTHTPEQMKLFTITARDDMKTSAWS
jgi:hypothetical protein